MEDVDHARNSEASNKHILVVDAKFHPIVKSENNRESKLANLNKNVLALHTCGTCTWHPDTQWRRAFLRFRGFYLLPSKLCRQSRSKDSEKRPNEGYLE